MSSSNQPGIPVIQLEFNNTCFLTLAGMTLGNSTQVVFQIILFKGILPKHALIHEPFELTQVNQTLLLGPALPKLVYYINAIWTSWIVILYGHRGCKWTW